ncbi:hypothetical protein [Yoonia litorea]|uniref:Dynamin family protein n=1 Tax=Yoonia litorea TaxID=1123755 RepID=A0A1I6N2M0_9RHOB|nr:hypothetical protein [Yoonia litorea]SFS22222.1 hypothetical protein SAMN05444714_3205 [Yoonia litorea]
MSNQSPDSRVHEKLARAVISGLLPDRVHEQAERLLNRLETPVRLGLMGMPQSGKSTILNLLVGREVLDQSVRLPTLELLYGEKEQAICTLPDGTKSTLNGVSPNAIAALSPVFVQLYMPLPALKKISVLEVVAPADPNALHRASQWAAKRCDIALWCTGGFLADEQRVWSQMPDTIKDHALLMVTRLDRLRAQGTVDDVMATVQVAATGEFNKILPIATTDAIAARGPDGSVDKDMLRESGGMALISAVLKQVDQGKRSALDMAEVLLLQNEDALADLDTLILSDDQMPDASLSEVGDENDESLSLADNAGALEAFAASEDDEDDALVEDHLADDDDLDAEDIAPPQARRRENASQALLEQAESERVSVGIARLKGIAARRAEEGMQPAPQVELQPATRDAYKTVVAHVAERANDLAGQIEDMGEKAPAAAIDHAVTDLNWLCDYLNDHGDDGDAALQRARDAAFDAADLVQLMQMEKRDSAAVEALSLLLQLKRELEADLAA